jgi:hypothetical protein
MITTQQRSEILRLLRKAEFDPFTVTFQFRQLGATEAQIGGRVDTWLNEMTIRQGSALITTLKDLA